jgi:large subunit ribosomal protein L18
MDIKEQKRIRRHKRIRAKISGTQDKPRLSVFKSNKYIHAQIIDDYNAVTLAAITDRSTEGKTKTERAKKAGIEIAKAAKLKKIDNVVFDRGGFVYSGRVKAFAEGAREGGLIF